MRPYVRLALAALLAVAATGCQLFEPIIAGDEFSVQAEGAAAVSVELRGGDGVSRLRQQNLINDLMLDLSRDPQRDSAAFDAMLELESSLQNNGYPLASVRHSIDRTAGVKVVFEMDQGPLVTVEKMQFVGNSFISSETLLEMWSRRETELGLGSALYVAAEIDNLGKSVRGRYQRLGFLDVVVTPSTPVLKRETEKVTVTITVQENTRYRLGSLEHDPAIEGRLQGSKLDRPVVGGPFQSPEVQSYSLAVTQYLRRHGHPAPQILTTVTPDPATHEVRVQVHGDPGEPVTVDRIDVEGFRFVSEGNIRKRIEIRTGERFDGKLEEDSLLRLYRSGLFRRVDVRHVPIGLGRIAVVFTVEETTRYLIEPMIGWGSYEELRGGVDFEMLSLFGSGFNLNLRGMASDKGYRGVVTVSDNEFLPAVFGYDTTFSVSADAFEREEPSFTDGAVGISPSLAHVFSRSVSGRVAYIFREHGKTESTVIDPGAQIGDYTEGSVLAELTWDTRDNPLRPRSGSRLSAQYKYYDEALGGDVSFERIRFTGSTILPLTSSTRFVLHAETGWLTPKDGSDAIPIQERIFNGGESTVRSYREDQLAPPSLKDVNGQVIGGEYRTLANVELRWAPWFQPLRTVDFEIALFGDAGNLGRFSDDYSLDEMKYAVGAGVRLLLPIGPLRFDFAHNPERDPGERSWTFHFSIGYPF